MSALPTSTSNKFKGCSENGSPRGSSPRDKNEEEIKQIYQQSGNGAFSPRSMFDDRGPFDRIKSPRIVLHNVKDGKPAPNSWIKSKQIDEKNGKEGNMDIPRPKMFSSLPELPYLTNQDNELKGVPLEPLSSILALSGPFYEVDMKEKGKSSQKLEHQEESKKKQTNTELKLKMVKPQVVSKHRKLSSEVVPLSAREKSMSASIGGKLLDGMKSVFRRSKSVGMNYKLQKNGISSPFDESSKSSSNSNTDDSSESQNTDSTLTEEDLKKEEEIKKITKLDIGFEKDMDSKAIVTKFKEGICWDMAGKSKPELEKAMALRLHYAAYKMKNHGNWLTSDHKINNPRLTSTQYAVIQSIVLNESRRNFQYFLTLRDLLGSLGTSCIDNTTYSSSNYCLFDYVIAVQYNFDLGKKNDDTDLDHFYPRHFFLAMVPYNAYDRLSIYPITINNSKPCIKFPRVDIDPLEYEELCELFKTGKLRKTISIKADRRNTIEFFVFDLMDFVFASFDS